MAVIRQSRRIAHILGDFDKQLICKYFYAWAVT
jgi:hypothetical protein